MAKTIRFTCSGCDEDFIESVQEIADMPQDEINAPVLCKSCGCDGDD